MIKFNELRITKDGEHLIIDVSVELGSIYNKIKISNIIIDSQDTYTPSGPSSHPIYSFDTSTYYKPIMVNTECNIGNVYTEDGNKCYVNNMTDIRLVLTKDDLNTSLKDNIFFVYIIANGYDLDNKEVQLITVGTVISMTEYYEKTLCYLKELNKECVVPRGFIDMILKFKAFELCIKTGNYSEAINYWNKYFKHRT